MIAGPTSLANNEPSLEFKELLRSLSNQATNLFKTYEKIMEMGLNEGFNEKQIKEMIKSELRDIKTSNQIYYLFNKEKINQKSNENYQNTKALINQQNEGKKDTEQSSTEVDHITPNVEPVSTDYDVNITSKPEIIDVKTENVVEKSKLEGITHEFEAHQNTIKAIVGAGFDVDKGITIIKGNPAQVLYQLEAYKQQDIREMIILLQKVK